MDFSFFSNLFFPQICLACRERIERGAICESCLAKIEIHDSLCCGKCFARMPDGKATCHFGFPYRLGAAGNYGDESLKALIHGLKFRSIQDAAEPLAELLHRHVLRANLDLSGFIIMPIPLSRARTRARGFNQSDLIARHFVKSVPLPLEAAALARTKHTKPQSETKSITERRENVRGGFTVKNPGAVSGKNILLIDDVTTSGATFLEASLALKSAGAKKIIALAAAKT